MKGRIKKKMKKKKANPMLQKYMTTVDDFVKSQSVPDESKSRHELRFVKKKSRKELRKEKRKMKKARMKSHYEGKKSVCLIPCGDKSTTTKTENLNKKIDTKKTVFKAASVEKDKPRKAETSKKGKKVNRLKESRNLALMEANEQEDREIKKLERCLGLNKRKNKKTLPQSFVTDGLDYILGVIDSGSSATGMYTGDDDEEDDMDMVKKNFEKLEDSDSQPSEEDEKAEDEMASEVSDNDDEEEGDDDEENDMEEDVEDLSEDSEEPIDSEAEDEVNKQESDDDNGENVPSNSKSDTVTNTSGKYVPPQLRNTGDDKRKAELEKLRRNIKGLLNRLSEPNMGFICSQLNELFMSYSRKDMNDTLTEVLLAACVATTLMPDRLVMEHALLVSILHHSVGLEVGAHFLETVVRRFDEVYKTSSEGKECDNLVAIVAHLYNFQVVHSTLIFDILKLLLGSFVEKNIELILFVLKNVGFALRKDDPLALKELISEAQRKANDTKSKFQDQTRVRFMLETMLALKNNDIRKIPGYDPEPVERLKKLQKTLINRSSGGSDVKLRVSLENLLAAEQVGRWWIIGSSWSGAPMITKQEDPTATHSSAEGRFSAKVLELAKKQRMNTDVRRNIFCVLMTSEDYLDAFEKLLRMGLKDKQEREIVHVLMDCCLQEKSFNAFYAVLGEKFCSHDRRFQTPPLVSVCGPWITSAVWEPLTPLSSQTVTANNEVESTLHTFYAAAAMSYQKLGAIVSIKELEMLGTFAVHVPTGFRRESLPVMMTFQFSLWDKLKELSSLSSSTFNNLVQLVTHFLQRKSLSLSVLKVIEFGELDKPTVRFLRQLLTKLLNDTDLEDLAAIFGRISGIPQLAMLREGLKLFISHFLLKNAQTQGPAEQAALLSERAEVAAKAMEAREAKLKL